MVPAENKAKHLRWSTIPKKQFIFIIAKYYLTRIIESPRGISVAGTHKIPQESFFFLIPPFSKFGIEGCPTAERGKLILCCYSGTMKIIC